MGVPLITGDKVINDTWSTVILTEMRAFDLLINGFLVTSQDIVLGSMEQGHKGTDCSVVPSGYQASWGFELREGESIIF